MKYLEFYKTCMELGYVPFRNGLCHHLEDYKLFHLFTPTDQDRANYEVANTAWHLDEDNTPYRESGEQFGPTRQNVVLFLAAMNKEL